REDLREAYGQDLPPARFGLDDVLAGGRRRHRRRQAAQVAGGALVVAAIAGIAVTGVRGLEPGVVPVGTPAGRATQAVPTSTTAAVRPNPRPFDPAPVIRSWLAQQGQGLAAGSRSWRYPDGGGRPHEKGTWTMNAVLTGTDEAHRTELTVTVAPTSTKPLDATAAELRPVGEPVTTPSGRAASFSAAPAESGSWSRTVTVPALKGRNPAVELVVYGFGRTTPPEWVTEQALLAAADRLAEGR
ncbi:MAG TPA: hypothetical protein VFP51_00690, partial [Nocardioidaceae bacterium]|nr:hypothetical protein [Nocardioidaceae bacterium]